MIFRCFQIPCIQSSYFDNVVEEQMEMEAADEPLIIVPVPPRKKSGDKIAVQNPNESGSILYATIPRGKKPGQSFMVRIPGADTVFRDKNGIQYAFSCGSTPRADPASKQPTSAKEPELSVSASSPPSSAAAQTAPTQAMALVDVPSGAKPGMILNVPVPGQNRFVKAEVPPGVSKFYVTYEPRKAPLRLAPSTPEHKPRRNMPPQPFTANAEETFYDFESRQYEVVPSLDNESQERTPLKYFQSHNYRDHGSAMHPRSSSQPSGYSNGGNWDSPLMEAANDKFYQQGRQTYPTAKAIGSFTRSDSAMGMGGPGGDDASLSTTHNINAWCY